MSTNLMLVICFFMILGCGNNNLDQTVKTSDSLVNDNSSKQRDSSVFTKPDQIKREISSAYFKIDSLTQEEKEFLQKISKENEFIMLSDKVERYYSENNALLVTKLVIPKSVLREKGYVFFDFLFNGKISDVNISYSYNLGQAAYGVGSIIGIDVNNYTHTITSCGVTSCVTQVYKNGEKIFERTDK